MTINDIGLFVCSKCHIIEHGELITSEATQKEVKSNEIITEENIFADYDDFNCKKCGFNKAQVLERGPIISDEESLTYLKCGKCGWTENLAKKIT
jgi:DNA-directed RNA polymerase subunit M/transcription elongation factor TFIIS